MNVGLKTTVKRVVCVSCRRRLGLSLPRLLTRCWCKSFRPPRAACAASLSARANKVSFLWEWTRTEGPPRKYGRLLLQKQSFRQEQHLLSCRSLEAGAAARRKWLHLMWPLPPGAECCAGSTGGQLSPVLGAGAAESGEAQPKQTALFLRAPRKARPLAQ